MQKEIPWNKLGRYISGESSPEERQEIDAWVKADPAHAELLDELQDIWKTQKDEEWDVNKAWQNISGKLSNKREMPLRLVDSTKKQVKNTNFSSSASRNRLWKFGIAASLILIIGVLLTLILSLEQPALEDAPVMQELIVERGQRSQFKLSDGTRVWLNSDSRMKVPAQFSGDLREVELQGEAFFDVTSNPDIPFVIHAGESVTTVLGTEFNVRAYPDEEEQVVVKEGRVAFGSHQASETAPELGKNQMGVLSGNNELTINEVSDLDRYISWTEGKLIFRDTPLHEVVKKLERKYDIECTIEDPALRDRTVTATFKEETITEVLKIIALSVGMSYEKEKRSVTLLSADNN